MAALDLLDLDDAASKDEGDTKWRKIRRRRSKAPDLKRMNQCIAPFRARSEDMTRAAEWHRAQKRKAIPDQAVKQAISTEASAAWLHPCCSVPRQHGKAQRAF